MGNETSFQSFPAHIHNNVTVRLAESHVVHTKIYPKYKSRKHVEYARDGFSEWLRPHESPDTDVILLGHSMGGILAAEVALLERHRILGTINFDTPFLGMHPGVIASGLGSLFRPAPESLAAKPAITKAEAQSIAKAATDGEAPSASSSSYFGPIAGYSASLMPVESNSTSTLPMPSSSSFDQPNKDPNYDPPFINDIRLPQRSGWANALHFVTKHSDGLTKATQSYVKSHLEFGGAMADYNGLKNRYQKVRDREGVKMNPQKRIRFVNYYTASTGRPNKPKPSPVSGTRTNQISGEALNVAEGRQSIESEVSDAHSLSSSTRKPVNKSHDTVDPVAESEGTNDEFLSAGELASDDEDAVSDVDRPLNHIDPTPLIDSEHEDPVDPDEETTAPDIAQSPTPLGLTPSTTTDLPQPNQKVPNLPPLPPEPTEPQPFDPSPYTDKDVRKLAEKDHARLIKTYKQAVKEHEKALSDRRKFLEKHEKNIARERGKQVKAEEKEKMKMEKRGMEKGERERAKVATGEERRLEKERERMRKEELRMKGEEDKLKSPKTLAATMGTHATDIEGAGDLEQEQEQQEQQEQQQQSQSQSRPSKNPEKTEKPKRDKKFCMLPSTLNGRVDPCWVRVFMPGVDEVGAHCGLFFVDGERYARFVDDVADRIEVWVVERT